MRWAAICWLFVSQLAWAAEDDTICAVVKIEIPQELTLERQGFEAIMKINNALDDKSLTNISVAVNFLDANGEVVVASSDPNHPNAKFFIRIANVDGIDNVSGTGTLAPASSATARWLIVPAPGTGGNVSTGTMYYVGAELKYQLNGIEETIEVAPDTIFVKPMPMLTLDYFLPSDVYADDPLTSEIEPIEPFTLGVRVRNNGNGPANKVKIESAQPKIVENKQGLLIDFEITGSYIDNQTVANSLLLDFGNIAKDSSATGRWVMQTTLSGKFTEFDASFSHADELGGSLTSLIETVNTHLLIRDVIVDLPGRDNVKDFLVEQTGVLTVFESDSVDTPVNNQSAGATLSEVSSRQQKLNFTSSPGLAYVKLPDPFKGGKAIVQAVRNDGKVINPANVWLSKTYNKDAKQWQHYIHLLDYQSTGSYFIDFEVPVAGPAAPVLQFINNWQGVEGGQIGFLMEASDPNGDDISFSVQPMPPGATITDLEPGKARFNWPLVTGMVGNYPVTVTASDGALYSNQNIMLKVMSANDTDGDGLDDSWEMEYFGDLSRDGSGDYDNDGISDKDEFLQGTDPSMENGPQAPVILTPNNTTVSVTDVELVVQNAQYNGQFDLTYFFEVYADAEMTQLIQASSAVSQGVDQTSWLANVSFTENQYYYWRARAFNTSVYSSWVNASFFYNVNNEAPTQAVINSPTVGAEVDSLMPVLSISNASDPDGDELAYQFTLYSDSGLTQQIASSSDIVANANGITQWKVAANLNEGGTYYWQVLAKDGKGLNSASEPAWFSVYRANQLPNAPTLIQPALDASLDSEQVTLSVQAVTDPDGDDVRYVFELDTSPNFDSELYRTAEFNQVQEGNVEWTVAGLVDNTQYYWRATAIDINGGQSEPTTGRFNVKLTVNPPQAPALNNPGNESWVESLTPSLSVHPVLNSDKPVSSYEFEVYADAGLTVMVDSGQVAVASYMVASPLADNQWYYWRARAVDSEMNNSAWSSTSRFFVNDKGADEKPSFTWLAPQSDIEINQGETILLSWDDQDPDSSASISLFYSRAEDAIVVDDSDAAFSVYGNGWVNNSNAELDAGYHYLAASENYAMAQWQLLANLSGRYEIQVFWPSVLQPVVDVATYQVVYNSNNETHFVTKQVAVPMNGWVSLGDIELDAGEVDVYLNGNNINGLIADKVRLLPIDVAGQAIVTNLDEDSDEQYDSFSWETYSVEPGLYELTALISDQTQTVKAVANAKVLVKQAPAVLADNSTAQHDSVGDWLVANLAEGYQGVDYQTLNIDEQSLANLGGKASFSWSFNVAKDAWYALNFRNLAGFENAKLRFEIVNGESVKALKPVSSTAAAHWVNLDKSWLQAGQYIVTAVLDTPGEVAVDAIELRELQTATKGILEIDNRSIGFSYSGNWKASSHIPGYYGIDYAYICSDATGEVTWRAQLPGSGVYEVYTRWTAASNRATDARYHIEHTDNTGLSKVTSVLMNQTRNNNRWMSLGVYDATDSQISVTLNNDKAKGCVIADAIKLQKIKESVQVLDNKSSAFSFVGDWKTSSYTGGYINEDYHFLLNTSDGFAKWVASVEAGSKYRVLAHWTSHANRPTQAIYTINDGSTELDSVTVSQVVGGSKWQLLGEYVTTSSNLEVLLTNPSGKGALIADAIKVELVE